MEILKNDSPVIKKELEMKPKVRVSLTTGEDFNDLILDYLMEKIGGKEEVVEVAMDDNGYESLGDDENNLAFDNANIDYSTEDEQSNYSEKHLLEYSMDEEFIKTKEKQPKNVCWSLLMLFLAIVIFPLLLVIKIFKDNYLRK